MTVYLFSVSLILHFVTFLILILLIKKVRTTFDYNELETQKRELEDLLAYYSVELKEENERFLKEILEKTQLHQKEKQYEEEQHEAEQHEEKIEFHETEKIMKENEETVKINEKPSLEEQAIQLYEEGYDPKEIAKKLNKGHGEIELLLKFHLSK